MQHTTQGDKASAGGPGGLCVVPKLVRYKGRSAHPVNAHIGVNALTATRIGLAAVDHMRDTMPGIYFHYIITECRGAVNIIPDLVTIAAHVRGWDTGYIKECNEIVNRCLRASALAAPRWKSAIFPARSPSTSSPISSASCWTMKWRSSAAITSTRESACPPTQTTSPAHCPRADRRL